MQKPLSREGIKLAALAAMAGNHFAQALLPAGTPLYTALVDIGYVTAPVMCYFLAEGFCHTRSRGRYALRLAGCALVSQLPYRLALGAGQLNMLFTLWFCLLMLWALDAWRGRWFCPIAAALPALATAFCDWPLLAACYTLMFAVCRRQRRWLALCFALAAWLFFVFQYGNFTAAGLPPGAAACQAAAASLGVWAAGGAILFCYNGRRAGWAGKHPALAKALFYGFYPAHLALLAAARLLRA